MLTSSLAEISSYSYVVLGQSASCFELKVTSWSESTLYGSCSRMVVNFNFSCWVDRHRFCFLQVWCPVVFASSGQRVLLKFVLQDILSHKMLQKCATLACFFRPLPNPSKSWEHGLVLFSGEPLYWENVDLVDKQNDFVWCWCELWFWPTVSITLYTSIYTYHRISVRHGCQYRSFAAKHALSFKLWSSMLWFLD